MSNNCTLLQDECINNNKIQQKITIEDVKKNYKEYINKFQKKIRQRDIYNQHQIITKLKDLFEECKDANFTKLHFTQSKSDVTQSENLISFYIYDFNIDDIKKKLVLKIENNTIIARFFILDSNYLNVYSIYIFYDDNNDDIYFYIFYICIKLNYHNEQSEKNIEINDIISLLQNNTTFLIKLLQIFDIKKYDNIEKWMKLLQEYSTCNFIYNIEFDNKYSIEQELELKEQITIGGKHRYIFEQIESGSHQIIDLLDIKDKETCDNEIQKIIFEQIESGSHQITDLSEDIKDKETCDNEIKETCDNETQKIIFKNNSKKYWIIYLALFIIICIYKYKNHNICSNQDDTFSIKNENTDNNELSNKTQNNDIEEDEDNIYEILVFKNNQHLI